jgi:hypothetical protein
MLILYIAIIAIIVTFGLPSLLTTVRHAAARQDRVSRVTGRSMPLPHRAHQQLHERLESNRGPFRGRTAENACFVQKLAILAEGVSARCCE